jgi:Mg-chelatase subunit ChlD
MNFRQRWVQHTVMAISSIAAVAAPGLWIDFSVAQTPTAASQLTAGPTYTSGDGKSDPKFPNVDVVFTLVSQDGNPVNAKTGDLKLTSEGKEIGTANSIRTFEKTGYGITAILAIDASGSMRGAPINAIHASIAKFVNQARSQDKVEVITFADDTQIDVPFGANQSALTKELETVQARGKFTHLYDGLLDGLAQFNASQPKRRQLVVISDGHDEGSTHPLTDVILKAKQLSVVIDSIGLTRDRGEYLGSLQQLSKETGGTYHRALSAQNLEELIGQGIDATRATPVAAFKTSHLAADNATHSIQLRWQPGNLSATAFINTPKANPFNNLWILGLGGCFLAGVVLLAISWFGAKRKTVATAQAYAPQPPPIPPPVPVVPPTPAPFSYGQDSGPAGRTPTQPETGPKSGPYQTYGVSKPAITTAEPQSHPLKLGNEPGAERSKTRLAVFFDAPDEGPYARINVMSGELSGRVFPVTATKFSIGALDGNHLVLPGDLTISGEHAHLHWEGSILKIEDNKSTNGTFVNSVRIAPGRYLLRPGDEIRIGQTVLIVDRA